MCVIIDRPAGVPIDEKILKTALNDNPDGWGWMYADNNELVCDWGMDDKDFFESYEYLPKDVHATLHFRWTTHGLTNVLNCHPFLFNGDEYAVVHNGVISGVNIKHKDLSDTYHFANGELSEALMLYGHAYAGPQHKRMRKYLEHMVGSYNKLVILRKDGERMYLNRKAGVTHKGLWLSNSGPLTAPMSESGKHAKRHYKSSTGSDWRAGWSDIDDVEGVGYYGGYSGGAFLAKGKAKAENIPDKKVEPKVERRGTGRVRWDPESRTLVPVQTYEAPKPIEDAARLEEAAEVHSNLVGPAVSAALGATNAVDADYAFRLEESNRKHADSEARARKQADEEDARDAALVAHYMAMNDAREDERAADEEEERTIVDYIKGRDRLAL